MSNEIRITEFFMKSKDDDGNEVVQKWINREAFDLLQSQLEEAGRIMKNGEAIRKNLVSYLRAKDEALQVIHHNVLNRHGDSELLDYIEKARKIGGGDE